MSWAIDLTRTSCGISIEIGNSVRKQRDSQAACFWTKVQSRLSRLFTVDDVLQEFCPNTCALFQFPFPLTNNSYETYPTCMEFTASVACQKAHVICHDSLICALYLLPLSAMLRRFHLVLCHHVSSECPTFVKDMNIFWRNSTIHAQTSEGTNAELVR